MPLPFILAGIAASAIHVSAKETNEEAQRISQEAQDMYNHAKTSLEQLQKKTETSLLNLGYSKKKVLESSIQQFLRAYEQIKHIQLSESVGLNEIANFAIDQQEVLELQEMSSIYQSAFSTGAAGAVLSIGALMTFAAPALLFTGISSSIKADENLEKAKTMYAEAEAAVEKMKISETMCVAIADRADMFEDLLNQLNGMFSECTRLLDGIIRSKTKRFQKKIDASEFTQEELKLIAVTRSLAGAVKAVIDTPIISDNGSLSDAAQDLYDNTRSRLPMFHEAVNGIKAHEYSVSAKAADYNNMQRTEASGLPDSARNVFALLAAGLVAVIGELSLFKIMAATAICLLIINNDTKSRFFKIVKNVSCFALGMEFCVLLYNYGQDLIDIGFFLLLDIAFGFIVFIMFALVLSSDKRPGNVRLLLERILGCLFFLAAALLVLMILSVWIGISFDVSIVITEILFFPFVMIGAYICELGNN